MKDFWKELHPGKSAPKTIHVVVVTPKDSANIYKYVHEHGLFELASVMHAQYRPPGDLGFIPRTYTEGGSPLDAVVLTDAPNSTGIVVDCRPIALLKMTANGIRDDRVLCVPEKDLEMSKLKDVKNMNPHTLKELELFFKSLYKTQSVTARIDDWLGASDAIRAVEHSIGLFKRKFET